MKVFVGMSGGVDSSLTAALLKEQGHEVVGVFMKNWTKDIGGFTCPWHQDMMDAKRVAVQLKIPFEVFDFQAEYKNKVVDYMLAEYKRGRTPNPDIMCNQEVKFKLFLNTALEQGADMIATGHYARVVVSRHKSVDEKTGTENRKPLTGDNFCLKVALDKNKDQSYFLYRITKEALAKTLMPIGELHKTEVRQMAKKRGLFTADRPDSQGICFVGEVGITEFIKEYIDVKPGLIIDKQSKQAIGNHQGALLYTIGQRHGLGVGGGMPYYVTQIDVKNNIVYVTTRLDDTDLWRSEINVSDCHWINDEPVENKEYQVRIRYRSPLVKCTLKKIDDDWQIKLAKDQKAVTPGQSAVIYTDEVVLGGGIIK